MADRAVLVRTRSSRLETVLAKEPDVRLDTRCLVVGVASESDPGKGGRHCVWLGWYFLEATVELNCRLVREKLRTEGLRLEGRKILKEKKS
jgi:hypothetical protein